MSKKIEGEIKPQKKVIDQIEDLGYTGSVEGYSEESDDLNSEGDFQNEPYNEINEGMVGIDSVHSGVINQGDSLKTGGQQSDSDEQGSINSDQDIVFDILHAEELINYSAEEGVLSYWTPQFSEEKLEQVLDALRVLETVGNRIDGSISSVEEKHVNKTHDLIEHSFDLIKVYFEHELEMGFPDSSITELFSILEKPDDNAEKVALITYIGWKSADQTYQIEVTGSVDGVKSSGQALREISNLSISSGNELINTINNFNEKFDIREVDFIEEYIDSIYAQVSRGGLLEDNQIADLLEMDVGLSESYETRRYETVMSHYENLDSVSPTEALDVLEILEYSKSVGNSDLQGRANSILESVLGEVDIGDQDIFAEDSLSVEEIRNIYWEQLNSLKNAGINDDGTFDDESAGKVKSVSLLTILRGAKNHI